MSERLIDLSRKVVIKTLSLIDEYQLPLLFIVGACLLSFGLHDIAAAQEGSEIFKDATVNLACHVLPGKFGAMLSAFTGMFALVAAATGNYRGAWGLVFVSVGCYIAKELVGILFDDAKC
ncbi:MAG: hypothetical protein U0136_16570 [Bdellovibrionota bacterium]